MGLTAGLRLVVWKSQKILGQKKAQRAAAIWYEEAVRIISRAQWFLISLPIVGGERVEEMDGLAWWSKVALGVGGYGWRGAEKRSGGEEGYSVLVDIALDVVMLLEVAIDDGEQKQSRVHALECLTKHEV